MGLRIPERTAREWIKYYVDTEDFKKVLSLEGAMHRPLPDIGVSKRLKGTNGAEKLNYLDQVEELAEHTATQDDVVEYTKKANIVSNKLGCELHEVKADDIRDFEAEPKQEPKREEPKKKEKLSFSQLDIREQSHLRQTYYKETTGYDLQEELDNMATYESIDVFTHEESNELSNLANYWKHMFRKGAKLFHPDTGGIPEEMRIWKVFALMMEKIVSNNEYNEMRNAILSEQAIISKIDSKTINEWMKEDT